MAYNHAQYSKGWMARRRARWVALGLCGHCGATPKGYKACWRCRVRMAAACRRYREKVKAVA